MRVPPLISRSGVVLNLKDGRSDGSMLFIINIPSTSSLLSFHHRADALLSETAWSTCLRALAPLERGEESSRQRRQAERIDSWTDVIDALLTAALRNSSKYYIIRDELGRVEALAFIVYDEKEPRILWIKDEIFLTGWKTEASLRGRRLRLEIWSWLMSYYISWLFLLLVASFSALPILFNYIAAFCFFLPSFPDVIF